MLVEDRPNQDCRDQGIHQRNDKCNLKGIEILDQKIGHEQSTDNGPDALEEIDHPDGRGIFLYVLGVEFTPVSKAGSIWERDGEEDQERRVKDWSKAKSLSGGGKEYIFEYSGEVDGKRKGHRIKELEENKDLYFLVHFFHRFTNNEGADRYQEEPIGKNDSESEFVSKERDEKFPQQEDLCNDTAQPHNKERGF